MRRGACAAAAGLAAAAALLPNVAAGQRAARRPLAAGDVDDVARLVAIEDRRELDAPTLERLLAARGDAGCVVPRVDGRLQPLCALWRPAALARLEQLPAGVAMRDAVAAAGALELPYDDPGPFVNVNAPGDLLGLG